MNSGWVMFCSKEQMTRMLDKENCWKCINYRALSSSCLTLMYSVYISEEKPEEKNKQTGKPPAGIEMLVRLMIH